MLDSLFEDMPDDFWGAMTHILWRVDWSDPFATGYACLNLVEACFWFGIGIWVIHRHFRRAGGRWDWAYAAAFFVFGASDVMESQVVPLWLIAAKGLIFAGIIALRYVVVCRYYPGSKM